MLKCPHCYISAGDPVQGELSTTEAEEVIERIISLSRPVVILSGGEPTMREDIFEIIRFGTGRGLRMVMGSCGYLVDEDMAAKLRRAGLKKIAISLDSCSPEVHDGFRGVEGAFGKAVEAVRGSVRAGLGVQIHTTVTWENFREIHDIISMGRNLGVTDFQVFFLVPTGRGGTMTDVTPAMYETMIREVLAINAPGVHIRPTCAPQFIRIARKMGLPLEEWGRGCIAGKSYCRITPTGDVTPCPYLPISCGNILSTPFREIWYRSEILRDLRDFTRLRGKCGRCEYRRLCGGCRARAYGLWNNSGRITPHGSSLSGDHYLDEEPWCPYIPGDEKGPIS
ncbi:radical SAM protein with 4Fe4S-binding SPASM domain [Methanolinea mesophila]|nr:radical SAM protein with 4Fe4S-binding SPASM domain [Methanolinea mesophila]